MLTDQGSLTFVGKLYACCGKDCTGKVSSGKEGHPLVQNAQLHTLLVDQELPLICHSTEISLSACQIHHRLRTFESLSLCNSHQQFPKPLVTYPAVSTPLITHPAVPLVTHPAVSQPLVTHPAVTLVTHPTIPLATQPAISQALVTHPAVSQPVVTHPAVSQPLFTPQAVPLGTHRAVSQMLVTHPAVSQP